MPTTGDIWAHKNTGEQVKIIQPGYDYHTAIGADGKEKLIHPDKLDMNYNLVSSK